MKRPTHDMLLAFLEGDLGEEDRLALLDRLDEDPELARELRQAALGLEAVRALEGVDATPAAGTPPSSPSRPRLVSPWWAAAASIVTLLASVPLTLALSDGTSGEEPRGTAVEPTETPPRGMPAADDPTYVLVLHGRWPDAATVERSESARRAREYWAWTASLAEEAVLVAAGDLRWEPGERLGPLGVRTAVQGDVVDTPDFVVGMLALRVGSYEEAVAIAQACPHLRYGGSVSIRRVGAGFVTVSGMGDWSD